MIWLMTRKENFILRASAKKASSKIASFKGQENSWVTIIIFKEILNTGKKYVEHSNGKSSYLREGQRYMNRWRAQS